MQLNLSFSSLSAGIRRGRCGKTKRIRQPKTKTPEPARKFDCREYEGCLDTAARQNSDEIGCDVCGRYDKVVFD